MDSKKVGLDCLYYEISMWAETFRFLNNPNNKLSQFEKNALLELFLLHSRNLIDFLENNGKPDDIRCSDFDISKKKVKLPSQNSKNKIQKFLSHLTWERVDKPSPSWDTPEIKQAITTELQSSLNALSDNYFPTKGERNRDDFNKLLIKIDPTA